LSETEAVFVIVPVRDEAMFTVRAIAPPTVPLVSPAPELPKLQVTIALEEPDPSLQLQPLPLAETKLSPVGSVSLTVIGSAAGSGPMFVTEIE
jgi:hypothetical protein